MTPPPVTGSAALQVVASAIPAAVTKLVVEVTAADISTARVVTIVPSAGTASGTITVPVGPSRTLTIRAFDNAGIETHRGTTTVSVAAGVNPTVSISLGALQGQLPIQVRVESLVITVTPADVTVRVDESARLQVVVKTANGDPVSVAAGDIRWATLQPSVASVGTTGEVLGVSPGLATIVAVYAGVGGKAVVTVKSASAVISARDLGAGPYDRAGASWRCLGAERGPGNPDLALYLELLA